MKIKKEYVGRYLQDEKLIFKVLDSPNAPNLMNRIKTALDDEKKRRLSFYNEITEQEKAEFINGEVVIHSPVKKAHNQVNGNLYKIIGTYVVENDLGFVGIEKILIQCSRNDYEPDLCYFNKVKSKKFKNEQSLFPIPEMIIEVLSKGTEKRDRGIKYEDYQNHGLKEYWIIDPKKNIVEQYVLNKKGKFEMILKSASGEIKSITIPGLIIPIKTIFDELLTHQFVRSIFEK